MYEPCPHCGGFQPVAGMETPEDFEDDIRRIAEKIFAGKKITHDPGLLRKTIENLQDRVVTGYGCDFPQIAYESPDFEMLRHLTENVYQFSAAKNWQQLKDMTLAMREGDKLLSEGEFFERVRQMNLKYNADWLRTERNTAIAGGQMASRWVGFEKDRDIMPLLEYSTVGDGNVRASHAVLDGVRKPIDDPFWSRYYPPNGWNCRCDVTAVPDNRAAATPDEQVYPPEISGMFETNLAKQGLIFPKGHPYYSGIPKAELRKAISYLPAENSYHSVKGKHGERIDVHILHNDAEVAGNLSVADDLIKAGYKNVRLLPDFHEKEAHLRKKFLPARYKQRNPKKNPDAWIVDKEGKDMVCDFKVLKGERNFSTRIAEAAKQADYAVIKLECKQEKLSDSGIERRVLLKMEELENLKGVIVLDKEGNIIFERSKIQLRIINE